MNRLVSFSSLIGSGERELLQGICNYYSKLRETVLLFKDFMAHVSSSDDLQVYYDKINKTETEADEIHEKLAEAIASGSFFSYIRDDFLDLLEKMDFMADYSKDVAKMFYEYNVSRQALNFLFKETFFNDFVQAIVDTVDSFGVVLSMLKKSPPHEILLKIKEVETMEEKADFIKDKTLIELHNKGRSLDVLDIITLREAINLMDNIADSAEDSSDIIIRLIAKGYK
ncbi:MAG: DUF47 family protein [Nitrososphaeria archaeon]|nr:DUF47 family protein [Nitrososphaerota archaeon]